MPQTRRGPLPGARLRRGRSAQQCWHGAELIELLAHVQDRRVDVLAPIGVL